MSPDVYIIKYLILKHKIKCIYIYIYICTQTHTQHTHTYALLFLGFTNFSKHKNLHVGTKWNIFHVSHVIFFSLYVFYFCLKVVKIPNLNICTTQTLHSLPFSLISINLHHHSFTELINIGEDIMTVVSPCFSLSCKANVRV